MMIDVVEVKSDKRFTDEFCLRRALWMVHERIMIYRASRYPALASAVFSHLHEFHAFTSDSFMLPSFFPLITTSSTDVQCEVHLLTSTVTQVPCKSGSLIPVTIAELAQSLKSLAWSNGVFSKTSSFPPLHHVLTSTHLKVSQREAKSASFICISFQQRLQECHKAVLLVCQLCDRLTILRHLHYQPSSDERI